MTDIGAFQHIAIQEVVHRSKPQIVAGVDAGIRTLIREAGIVGDGTALETPFIAEKPRQKFRTLAAPFVADAVQCRHDAVGAALFYCICNGFV